MYPPNIPAPITTTSNGSPPLPFTSGQELHTHLPSTSSENSVCWTLTCWLGSEFRRGSINSSFGIFGCRRSGAHSIVRLEVTSFQEFPLHCGLRCCFPQPDSHRDRSSPTLSPP